MVASPSTIAKVNVEDKVSEAELLATEQTSPVCAHNEWDPLEVKFVACWNSCTAFTCK